MDFFYSAGAMGFGFGYFWHKLFKFPDFPIVTKTLTFHPKTGKYCILYLGHSIYNRMGLNNGGVHHWIGKYGLKLEKTTKEIIVSISGNDHQIQNMVDILELFDIQGIELNYSCPAANYNNKKIPKRSNKYPPLHLKLNYKMDPYKFDLNNIESIRVNSVPYLGGGLSGKLAQKENWKFIEKFNKEGLNISGCSAIRLSDINRLKNIGCKEIGIGSMMLINPFLVEKLY